MVTRIRRLCFLAAAGAFYYSGLSSVWFRFRNHLLRREEICVLGFHRVLTEAERAQSNSLDAIIMGEEAFSRTLEYLGRHFEVISLSTFLKSLRGGSSSLKPQCLITFDDGWRDNLTTALPLLRKHSMPAMVFAVTSFMERRQTFWVERLRRLWRDPQLRARLAQDLVAADNSLQPGIEIENLVEHLKHMPASQRDRLLAPFLEASTTDSNFYGDEMLTWQESENLQQSGVDIESHTVNHPLLTYESDSAVASELAESKRMLEEKLQKRVRAFAYPNGTWDKRVRDLVEKAGYECAFITQRGWHARRSDPFAIRRTMLYEGKLTGLNGRFSPAVLAFRLSGLI